MEANAGRARAAQARSSRTPVRVPSDVSHARPRPAAETVFLHWQQAAGNRAVTDYLAGTAKARPRLPIAQLQPAATSGPAPTADALPAVAPAPTAAAPVDASARSTAHRTLRSGDSGNDVRVMQNKLNDAGADPPIIFEEASFGSRTLQAVRAFQSSKGLPVDGVAGPQTWAALDAITAGRTMDEADDAVIREQKGKADELRVAGQFAAAEVIFRAIYANPKVGQSARSGVTFSLGTCAHALGRFAEAIGFYQEVMNLPQGGTEDFRLDAAQRIREARLGQPPGLLASKLNAAPVAT
jgi:hypothetical protein